MRRKNDRGLKNAAPARLVAGAILVSAAWISTVTETVPDAANLSGVLSHVRDGDTLEVDGIAVRLRGITCDEHGPLADAATHRVRAFLGGPAACRLNGERNRDRLIGWCSAGGQDIGAMLVREGLCGRCPRYDPENTYTEIAGQVRWEGEMPAYCSP
ncbi:MAG: thermonuclease family protein [Pseudomonadota bacterium]